MSDIVTTLQDKDGNNIYPIAGGVNGNTITTAMLQNGAVTGAKIGSQEVTASNIDWSTIIDKIYPVGSIYMSATLSTPAAVAAALGGTWVDWGSGRVPVGVDTNDADFNTVEETGGAKTHRHDFKIGMRFWFGAPIGDNFSNNDQGAWSYAQSRFSKVYNQVASAVNCPRNSALTASSSTETPDIHESVGDTDTGSSLQPYITCYMYKRTA